MLFIRIIQDVLLLNRRGLGQPGQNSCTVQKFGPAPPSCLLGVRLLWQYFGCFWTVNLCNVGYGGCPGAAGGHGRPAGPGPGQTAGPGRLLPVSGQRLHLHSPRRAQGVFLPDHEERRVPGDRVPGLDQNNLIILTCQLSKPRVSDQYEARMICTTPVTC